MASTKGIVGLFATCLVDLIRPEIGFSTARLLQQAGYKVEVPDGQTCCGQPHFNSGALVDSVRIAERFVRVFERYEHVVVPSGSCAAMVKIHYPEILADRPKFLQGAKDIASRCYELTEFLTDVADIQLSVRHELHCTYHDSCSGFRELGICSQPRQLLGQIDGLTITECNDSTACCGFGGTFCVKYPEISNSIATEKANNVDTSGAEVLLGGDLGCLMNIAGMLKRRGSNVRVRHIAEVLAGQTNQPAIGQPR
ncbi:MAG: (Fe-S)-binding protein [Acidiferrobacterales bacterium]|nr:(Fe-S)-binding protein [Acidiferrobacterales bacterium]